MIARLLLSLGVLAMFVGTASTAEAVCQNNAGENYRRTLVAQPPDLVFKAGVPSTQEIPVVFVTYNAVGAAPIYSDCGAVAVSSIPGVTLEGTYCSWAPPSNCFVGQSVAVDKSQPDPGSAPAGTYRHYEQDHLRPIRVFYDGQAPAGTRGRVDISTIDEIGNPVMLLGKVNVYIVGTKTAPTWFTVATTKKNIAGDSLVLDNEHINVQPAARLFAMHYGSASKHWDHPIAVTYDTWLGKWKIRNEDGVKMPVGLSFHVRIDPSATVLTTPTTYVTNELIIDNPVANDNPFATIVVTPWSSGNRRMTRPFAVRYIAPHWRVLFLDYNAMPVSDYNAIPYNIAGFFVKVVGTSMFVNDAFGSSDPSGFSLTSKANGAGLDMLGNPGRSSGDTRFLNKFCWATGSSPIPVIATLNQTPLPYPAPNPGYYFWEYAFYGASFVGNSATVYHENFSDMNAMTSFNVMAPYRPSCAPPNQ